MPVDTTTVRHGEELDVAALAAYLSDKIDGAGDGLTVEQFPSGHSNLTYLLRFSGGECVLRRGPLGPVAPKAHDMAREFRVLHAVHPHFPEAPRVLHLCQDPSVLGSVFFLMERRNGIVLRDQVPPDVARLADHPHLVSEAFIDCMVRLHAIDVSVKEVADLGKPEGFLERQVHGWAERWQRARTEDLPAIDRIIQWLVDHMPVSSSPSLVHNDYKLDNVMLPFGSVDQIEAVLDWEMATIGDPLADLGLTLCYWSWVDVPELRARGTPSLTAQPGWYTRDQFVHRYAEGTGRDLTHIGYYEVLGIFKLAVILQQIYYRYFRGQTQDERFRNFDGPVRALGALAAAVMEKQR